MNFAWLAGIFTAVPAGIWCLILLLVVILVWFVLMKRPIYEAVALGFILLVAVLLIGHVLNIAINLLGAFVHTSRLQYLEFFGKFFEDGGVGFAPATPSEEYSTAEVDQPEADQPTENS